MTIIAFMGRSNTGKDTGAAYLQEKHGYKPIAFAGPLKRLAKAIYEFSDEQLYGPPEARNAIDPRFLDVKYVESVFSRLYPLCPEGREILKELFPDVSTNRAEERLLEQFMNTIVPQAQGMTARKVLQQLGTEWGRSIQEDLWLQALLREVTATRGQSWAITDCRFPNEAQFVDETLLNGYVFWIDASVRVPVDPAVDAHSSEPRYEDVAQFVHVVIDNNGTPEQFHANIERALNGLTAW